MRTVKTLAGIVIAIAGSAGLMVLAFVNVTAAWAALVAVTGAALGTIALLVWHIRRNPWAALENARNDPESEW